MTCNFFVELSWPEEKWIVENGFKAVQIAGGVSSSLQEAVGGLFDVSEASDQGIRGVNASTYTARVTDTTFDLEP